MVPLKGGFFQLVKLHCERSASACLFDISFNVYIVITPYCKEVTLTTSVKKIMTPPLP